MPKFFTPPKPVTPNRRARRAALKKHEKATRRGQAAVVDIRFQVEGDHIVMSIAESTGITRNHILDVDAAAITADRAARACDEWELAHPAQISAAGAELLDEAQANLAGAHGEAIA